MDDAVQSLRARRHLDTHREIHRAALDLFEAQGVRETTVPQIAERAGVSPRTFFRHFAAKEHAALAGQARLTAAVDALEVDARDAPSAVLRAVESAVVTAMADADDIELDERRRIARLLEREPDLRALAAAQDAALAERLRARLTTVLDQPDPLVVRLLSEVAATMWKVSWDRWSDLVHADPGADAGEVMRRCSAALRVVVR